MRCIANGYFLIRQRYSAIEAVLFESAAVRIIRSMANVYGFLPGDFLIFQIESGFGLLRVIGFEERDGDDVWHLIVYRDLFQDVEMAEMITAEPGNLTPEFKHIALTGRAFESTQVSKLGHVDLSTDELDGYRSWEAGENEVSDRSVRLHLGFR